MDKEKTIKFEFTLSDFNPHHRMFEGTIEEAMEIALGEIYEHVGGSSAAYIFTRRIFRELSK